MTFENEKLLDEEHKQVTDVESQDSDSLTWKTAGVVNKSWLPAALVVYSLLATALLIIPHLGASSRLLAPYCTYLTKTATVLCSNHEIW
jgi:hypothetical protein